ncbi:MAG: ferredoxin [Acidimicrobiales bacterium]
MTSVQIQVVVDRDRCIGSGNCVFWAPASFELDDEGMSVPAERTPDSLEALQVAVDGCPTKAISIEVTGTEATSGKGE